MREVPYDRAAAVNYARRWAPGRNPVISYSWVRVPVISTMW